MRFARQEQGMTKSEAQAWVYGELDRMYPPLHLKKCERTMSGSGDQPGAIDVIESPGAKKERSKGLAGSGAFSEGDRVEFRDSKSSELLTGTITSINPKDGRARIQVDQTQGPGGVPVGRIAHRLMVDLKKIQEEGTMSPDVQSEREALRDQIRQQMAKQFGKKTGKKTGKKKGRRKPKAKPGQQKKRTDKSRKRVEAAKAPCDATNECRLFAGCPKSVSTGSWYGSPTTR